MIDTDRYEEQLEDDNTDTLVIWRIAKESIEEVKRLREVLVGESKGWTTDELVEKALTLHDKALVFDIIYDWHTRMQLQGKGIAHNLDRMDWLLKNPTKEYEDYDKEYDEE